MQVSGAAARNTRTDSTPPLSAGHTPSPVPRVRFDDEEDPTLGHTARARIEWSDIETPSGSSAITTLGWGTGDTRQLARDRALSEACERHAVGLDVRRHARASFSTPPIDAVDPTALVHYAPHRRRAAGFPFRAFDAESASWWIEGWEAESGQPVHLLADTVLLPRAFDAAYRRRLYTYATSSGCATGATHAEAALRATCELIERDAVLRHWFAMHGGSTLHRDGLPAKLTTTLAWLEDLQCEAGLQCLPGVRPTLLAWARHDGLSFTAIGSACSIDPAEAAERAMAELTDAVLLRLEDRTSAPDVRDIQKPADHARHHATTRTWRESDGFLTPSQAPLSWRDLLNRTPLQPGVRAQDLAHAAGRPLYLVDLSTPQQARLGASCAITLRVLAPGWIPLYFGALAAPSVTGLPDPALFPIHPLS